METEDFKVKTAGFEGPFGLLLNLIEKRKLFINDVSLSAVTEDYLNYMNSLGGLSPAEVSSFVLVASTLLLIKSKSLLPNLDLTPEEEGDIKNLEERLRLYEIFSKLGLKIKENFGRDVIFMPEERKNDVLVFLPDTRITKESMMIFAQDVLHSIPKKVFMPKIEVKSVISIEEMIDKLTERIKNAVSMSFKDFSGRVATKEDKVNVIVSFLAVLEMTREGLINVVQEFGFGDIIINKKQEEAVEEAVQE